ncbi:MAG: hypothetical protein IPH61_04650 [Bacteroidetes bacterium]|nr:hypothetical protein [Bacteroidota bacterium]
MNYLEDDKGFSPMNPSLFSKPGNKKSDTFFKLFPRTHILIHGYGSAGKAGFALKLLLTPPLEKDKTTKAISEENFNSSISRRKVLIISFLYQKNITTI